MRPGAGKGKGSSFERKVAKQLSAWLSEDPKNKTELIRSVLSGGWRSEKKGEWRQIGDLAANGPFGERFRAQFAVECKHHREIDIGWALWRADGGDLGKWWKKLRREIKRSGQPLSPMLIFRANRQAIMVALPLGHVGPAWDDQVVVKVLAHRFVLVKFADLLERDPALFMVASKEEA